MKGSPSLSPPRSQRKGTGGGFPNTSMVFGEGESFFKHFNGFQERGQPGLTLENIEKPLIHFASPRPRKPLNCLKKLSPSPKTIEVFGKPPPVPFPCDRGGGREGDPFIQCPLPSSLIISIKKRCSLFFQQNKFMVRKNV